MRKNIIALLLAVVMLFSLSLSALASENDYVCMEEEDTAANTTIDFGDGTRGTFSGYASKFVSSSSDGSFTVTTTGTPLLSAGLTFKTSCDESNNAVAIITIKRPNGGYILQSATFSANDEAEYTFFFLASGNYTVEYSVYVPSGATVHMQCWIYG